VSGTEYGAAGFTVTITPNCCPVLDEQGDRIIGRCTCGAYLDVHVSGRWLADHWMADHILRDDDGSPTGGLG
jgi:hypothetical protein